MEDSLNRFDKLIKTDMLENFNNERIRKNNDQQLFTILSLGSSEAHYSKTLQYLLNYSCFYEEEQMYEKLFLKLFYEHVLHREFPKLDFEKIQVVTEYMINNDNRSRFIDLVIIEPSAELIPIEVKIYSGDQDKQRKRQLITGFIY